MSFKKLIDFWFPPSLSAAQKGKLWYTKDVNFDLKIRDKYLPLLERARNVDSDPELQSWLKDDDVNGRLAFVILTDQFPRNIFRGQKEAFEFDHLALAQSMKFTSDASIERLFKTLPQERVNFFFLPLMHSEELKVSELSVKVFKKLASPAFYNQNQGSLSSLEFAEKHLKIIKEFGRYPHRNEAMKRESTKEEEEYLKNAERFGQ